MEGLIKSLDNARKKHKGFRMKKKPKKNHGRSVAVEVDEEGAPFFPWLANATILLQGEPRFPPFRIQLRINTDEPFAGDSMERLHLSDFCEFVGGEAINIHPNHTAAPPVYRKPMPTILNDKGEETKESIRAKEERRTLEDSWEARKNSWFFTRPWVCDIKEYNATIINTFLWVSVSAAASL